jgi:hypothetical protein
MAKYQGEKRSWGYPSSLTKADTTKKPSIAALKEADPAHITPLIAFATPY